MHGQGNYTTQVGRGPYAPPPAFQQHPAAPPPPPPTSHHGPPVPQPQVIQQGRPSFHFTPSILPYQQAMPGVPHQVPSAPLVSSGMSSAQSYLTHSQHPQAHVSTQSSHSHPTSEQTLQPWSQNVRQLPPTAPIRGPSAYPLTSSQGRALERGPPNQPASHAPPPQLPPYSSSSSFLMSDPFESSVLTMRQHCHLQPTGPLPPPPPPPLPPPPSSPPGVPPHPPSSPPSDVLSKNGGSCSLKEEPLDGDNSMLECLAPVKPVEDRSVPQIEVLCQHTEKNGNKVELADADVTHSPADSDMDMEDDITHPDEEKKNCSSNNSNDDRVSISQEDYAKEKLQALQHGGGDGLPKVALDDEAAVLKDHIRGVEVPSDDGNGQTKQSFDVSVKDFSSQHENLSGQSVAVVQAQNGYGKLSSQLVDGANAFKLLQGYTSDSTSENEGDNLLRDVSPPCIKDGSRNFDAEKRCNFGSEFGLETLSKSNKHMLSKSMIDSPKDVMQGDKTSPLTRKFEEFSDKSHRGQESVSFDIDTALQQKDSLSKYDANMGPEGASFHKADMKNDSAKVNVDEFGRLVREGVSDSDTSDSPRYRRRHAKRARKRSRSQSRSRSPPGRRRRRSPWKRKERRDRSRSLSPNRRRSRSRSPVLRRDRDVTGDKLRWDKGQLPECFDFLRGKCYRGATCRYSHHDDKSERLRYHRGKQQYRDMLPAVRSPDFREESKVLPDKEPKDNVRKISKDLPGLKEVKVAKELPVVSTTHSDKLNSLESASLLVADVVASNLSGHSAHDTPSGKENSFIAQSPAQYCDKVPEIVDKQDKPDGKQGPTGQLHFVGNPVTKPDCAEGVPSQSLSELPQSIANHPSHLAPPLPSVSQVMNTPAAQPIIQGYNLEPPTYSAYQAPVAYQHSHSSGSSNYLSSSVLPPPLPPRSYLSFNVTTREHNIPSENMQESLLPPRDGLSSYTSVRGQPTELLNHSQTARYQTYDRTHEPDQVPHVNDNFGSSSLHLSNLTSRQGGPHIIGEDCLTGHPVQGMNPLQSVGHGQTNSLLMQSPSKGMHSSLGGNLPSDSNSSHSRSYFQQAAYGRQYFVAGSISAELVEPAKLSSSTARTTPDFPEGNQPSYMRDSVGSRIVNHFNPYASTFDLPLSSKFSSNALTQDNDATIGTKYGAPFGLGSVSVDGHKTGSVGSKNMFSSSSSGLPAASILPRLGGNQYDPLFDSIEPASNSFSRADFLKHEAVGDSDNMPRFSGSGRVLNMEGTGQHEGGTAASTNDSLEIEECGETADAEIGAVLNGSSSNPNDTTDLNAGEIEIDQVKASGKKKKGKDSRSMKLFKISIATFVKEVLKPSWRQGNMSKEAFKTIVKKTVDKVSGAMKSHHIPRSQSKINHYIDSSRGKLTKLVMGYVDKYVKV
ncbi:zinc finger CCCH domain-containing protein 55 isoform X2 [Sesamum indicum]|uniref:Zinc finger CCCH domain-containing protein 55 isoform X2 n=1 Tax=Sesamum indicum TaxID=4182 RepID=A0A8M8UX77_SESIN|nr:zinc finger CCCH domain-containing protein 55 isoform X2 [Sesamum indicum]